MIRVVVIAISRNRLARLTIKCVHECIQFQNERDTKNSEETRQLNAMKISQSISMWWFSQNVTEKILCTERNAKPVRREVSENVEISPAVQTT